MILETERLSLRPLAARDAERRFRLLNDPEVMVHWDVPEIDDPDLCRVIVEGQVAEADAGKAMHWTIHALAGDEFLGACDLSEIDRWHKRAEIGFMLGRGEAALSRAVAERRPRGPGVLESPNACAARRPVGGRDRPRPLLAALPRDLAASPGLE